MSMNQQSHLRRKGLTKFQKSNEAYKSSNLVDPMDLAANGGAYSSESLHRARFLASDDNSNARFVLEKTPHQ